VSLSADAAAGDNTIGSGLAAGACRAWELGVGQNAAARSVTTRTAARQAGNAGAQDTKWKKLWTEMDFVSSLPETGNSSADQRTAAADEQDIDAQCGALGVGAGH